MRASGRTAAARDDGGHRCGRGRGDTGTLVRKKLIKNMTQQTPTGRIAATPADPRGHAEGADRRLAHARAEIREADRPAAGAEEVARGRHRREPVHRAVDAHARVVRARGQAARRRRGESRSAALFAREGREHARHDLHARGLPRRRVRDPRCGVRRAGTRRRKRAAARERVVGRRSARRASDPGAARCAHDPPGEETLRRSQGRHRRRRPAFARGALGLARARDARRRGDPHRRAARADARSGRIPRLRTLHLGRQPASPASTSS